MSNYPNSIDDDSVIPRIDDNINDIGGDVINDLRDATFNIESTLGVNPQGSVNSVADRLNTSLDPAGNIIPSSLAGIGLVYLPITNSQISATAAIQESKLNLTYTTATLYNLYNSLNNSIEVLNGFLSLTGVKLQPHLDGTNYNHELSAILVDSALPMLKTNPQPLVESSGTNTINRNTTNADTLIKDISDDLLIHEKSDGNPGNTATSGGTIAPENFAHVSAGLYLNPANFSSIPQTIDTVQEFADYIDNSSLLLLGSRIQTLYANGIPISSRSSALLNDGYGAPKVPITPVIAYLLGAPPTPNSSTPVDDINHGDDVILFQPTSTQLSNDVFDEQFALVLPGDILTIDYGNGTGLSYQFLIDSIKAQISGTTRVYAVRINGKNLFSSNNAVARIDGALDNRAKWGVLAPAVAPNQISPSAYESLILANPRSAVALGNGFDGSVFDSTHYNLYLVLYPFGNQYDTTSLIQLPPIDVTGNGGITPEQYTLDFIVNATNTAFRQPGFNYRFIAFEYNGNFGIMLADPYNNASFSIIGGSGVDSTGTYNYGSGSSNANATNCASNVIDNIELIDPLGLGIDAANVGSPPPAPIFNYLSASAANIAPVKLFYPLSNNYYYANGAEKDRLKSDPNYFNQIIDVYGDGYWPATIYSMTTFTNRVQVSYLINLNLSMTGLEVGKSLVVQPEVSETDSRYNYRDYGRFIISSIEFNNCNTANGQTVITVYDAVHGSGVSPTTTSPVNTPVNIYFSDDSVAFDQENVFDQNSTNYPYKRFFEIYVDQNGHSFSHERARFSLSGSPTIDNIHFSKISSKLRGYSTNGDISIRLQITSYNTTTGIYIGQLGRWNPGPSTFTNLGPITTGKKGETVRFYDETNIDYIDFIFNINDTVQAFSNQTIDIQLFPSLLNDDEVMIVSSCQVNDSTKQVSLLQDLRQFGNISENQLSTSALNYIAAADKYTRDNGVVQGFDYVQQTTNSGTAASITSASGGLVTITGVSNFTQADVGRYITISNASTSANNGTFLINSVTSATQIVYNNTGGTAPDSNNGSIHWTEVPLANKIQLNGGIAYIQGKLININNIITEIPVLQEILYPSLSTTINTITWFLCANVNGEIQFVASTDFDPNGSNASLYNSASLDHNRLFWVVNPNSNTPAYVIRGTYLENLVINFTDLTILYVITATVGLTNGITQPYIISSSTVSDARRYVANGINGLTNFVLSPEGNFRSFAALDSWLQQLTKYKSSLAYQGATSNINNLGKNVIVKGTWLINSQITLSYLSPVIFTGDDATFIVQLIPNSSPVQSGQLNLGSNITFKNIHIDNQYDPVANSDPNYSSSVYSNTSEGCIYITAGSNENIIIDNCLFTSGLQNRFPFITINFPSNTTAIQNLFITNNRFETSAAADDKLAVVAIQGPSPESASTIHVATIINSQISNNSCNKNQLIVISGPFNSNADTIYDSVAVKNMKINNNVCGAICYLTLHDTTPYPTYNTLFNTSKDSNLTISNNTCRFIYMGFSDGTIGKSITGTFYRASQLFNSLMAQIGSTAIIGNTCSWIHTGANDAFTPSNLFVCDNECWAFDPNFLIGYYDTINDVKNVGILIDATNGGGGDGGVGI